MRSQEARAESACAGGSPCSTTCPQEVRAGSAPHHAIRYRVEWGRCG